MTSINVPLLPGRYLHLYAFHIDDSDGRKTRQGRWTVTASWQPYSGEPATSKEEEAARYIGTIAKGHYRLGPSKWQRCAEVEVAVGGEDSMVQLGAQASVLGGIAVGVRIPRRWIRSWVYERRQIVAVRVGYIGSVLEVALMHDDRMADMERYYREQAERGEPSSHVTERMLDNGWHRRIGQDFWDRQVVGRVFGKTEHVLEAGEPITVTFTMPGDTTEFVAVVKREVRTWKRPRGWWYTTRDAFFVSVDRPPQFAGKGENSWDCGDDGIYGMTVQARSPREAVQGYIKEVLSETAKRGPASGVR